MEFWNKIKKDEKDTYKAPICEDVAKRKEIEEKEKVIIKFFSTFKGIIRSKIFMDIIEDYEINNSKESFRVKYYCPERTKNYLFLYKEIKINIKITHSNITKLDKLEIYQLVDSEDKLKIFEIIESKKNDEFNLYNDGLWEYWSAYNDMTYHSISEKFERFSIKVMQHIMAELKNEEAKRIEYFESLISAEDLE